MNRKKLIAVTQREVSCNYGELRDSIDRRWYDFFLMSDLSILLIPNNIALAKIILGNSSVTGILLTGGGDISSLGGKDNNREEIEEYLIEFSINKNLPLLGICRGMQKIQDYFGIKLQKIYDHVKSEQKILINNEEIIVNSYHNFGTTKNNTEFEVFANSEEGIIKAIKHKSNNISGIMWHPERIKPFRRQDIEYFKSFYT
jgi:gamma-glutamyl-gamma-aminobutyrate hydrolase PuuD